MKYYIPEEMREVIEDLVTGRQPLERPSDPEGHVPTLTGRILEIINQVSETCYEAGRLEVRQSLISALDLRHLLGINAR
jgi:hypothetical protein